MLIISILSQVSLRRQRKGPASLVGRHWLGNIKTWLLLRNKRNWGHQGIFSLSWCKVAKHVSKSGFWGKWTCFETHLNIASIIHQKKLPELQEGIEKPGGDGVGVRRGVVLSGSVLLIWCVWFSHPASCSHREYQRWFAVVNLSSLNLRFTC